MPNAQGLELINIIKDDITLMDLAIENQLWSNAAFLAQQVIEKSLKLVLMSHGVPDRNLFSHDIDFLRIMLYSNFKITVPSNIITTANKLNSWEALARYDNRFLAKPTEVKECAKIAKNYFKLVTSN